MTIGTPESYGWLYEELAWFGEAGCVTVGADVSRDDLAAALGADLTATAVGVDATLGDDDMYVSFVQIDGRPVATEGNGFAGSDPSARVFFTTASSRMTTARRNAG